MATTWLVCAMTWATWSLERRAAPIDPPLTATMFPGKVWEIRDPASLRLDAQRLDRIAQLLGGRGCIVKDGYVVKSWGSQSRKGDWASSAKPVLSTLLMFAVKEGRLSDFGDRVADFGWPLKPKDAPMTFVHLANMTSGYARPEEPGAAWAYNDFAIMLYQKTLFDRVFRDDPDAVARRCFAPLQLEDGLTFEKSRRRLSASVRDFARLGWFWLNRGDWNGPVIDRRFFDECQRPHVVANLPQSSKDDTDDYLKIGSYGGGSNHFSKSGPGIYGFNWWFNASGRHGADKLTWPDAPRDAFASIGAAGNCAVMIPSLNLVLVAASANWGEFDPGNHVAPMNQVLRLLVDAGKPNQGPLPWAGNVQGELKKWHKITLTFDGPECSETSEPNPFRDFRLTVAFSRRLKTVIVPGYFAADGNAAQTGAKAGNKWRVHFMPDEEGEWSYQATMARGKGVALKAEPTDGDLLPPTGASGTFRVGPTDKSKPDTRGLGLLKDVGTRYWEFAEKRDVYLKGAADSPENFLAFADFDDTKPTHRYAPHARDWRTGDPTWKDGKGKNIIGALNYLHSRGVNGVYFLTMNVKGDGKDVWPWVDPKDPWHYDVSKLAQWEIVFEHMDQLGHVLHVVHQEQENDQLLDGGELGPQRRIYYRELIARFAHHPALIWNLGEENTNTTEQLKSFARFIKKLDPYKHPIVVHTFPSQYDKVYGPLLGDRHFSGASLQVGNMTRAAKVTKQWLERSVAAGRPWACFLDEIGPARIGVVPDNVDAEHNDVRKHALWAPLLAGGSGAEWLFGYDYPGTDIDLEDFRSREKMWDQTTIAVQFFRQHIPVRQMQPNESVVHDKVGQCLALEGKLYLVYLPEGGAAKLKLPAGSYSVQWFDPRAGGGLQTGEKSTVQGADSTSIGAPPRDPGRDWAVLLTRLP